MRKLHKLDALSNTKVQLECMNGEADREHGLKQEKAALKELFDN